MATGIPESPQSNPPLGLGCNEGLGPNARDDERERTSYLTADEVQAVQTLHQRAPYALCSVSMGFFSITRKTGGCTYKECLYIYMDGHDECVRDDVLKMVRRMRKQASKQQAPAPKPMLDLGA